VLLLIVVAPLAAYLPLAAMAGVLLLVGWGLIDFASIRKIFKVSRTEGAVLVAAMLATLFVQLGFAIYLGVMLSLMLYLRRTAQPRIVDVKPDRADETHLFTRYSGLPDCPQLKILRVQGSIFFGAAPHIGEALRNVPQPHVLIDAMGINFIDLAGANMLATEAKRRRRQGGGLYLYRVNDEVMRILRRSGRLADIGESNIFSANMNAVGFIYSLLNPQICGECERRIFSACQTHLPDGAPRGERRESAAAVPVLRDVPASGA
jgi:SulP family sulfate permease